MTKKTIISNAKKTDNFLRKYLNYQNSSSLLSPMKYGVLSGGKKIRSSVIINTGKIFNINSKKLLNICGAVECIHSYSLIHDDLPCMDNDKFRRGKASTHVKYGEATAVLAGSSLLTLAFEMITNSKYQVENKIKVELIKDLAECSGHTGIAGGQDLDLSFEKKKKNFNQIILMQKKKTGKLFNFCCRSVGIISKKNNKIKNELSAMGEEIGLLFQLADDFIDIRGSKKLAGKTIQKDKKKGKSTLINLFGYEKAYSFAYKLKKNILKKLLKHGRKADDLVDTVNFILGRDF